jgi:uncharacterized protein (AIM24 family)
MALQYRIEGTTLPVVTITLNPGEKIYSSAGGMSWMTQQIQMDTNTGGSVDDRAKGFVYVCGKEQGQSGGGNINLGQLLGDK